MSPFRGQLLQTAVNVARERFDSEMGGHRARHGAPSIAGISESAIAAFCDAVEFGVHRESASEADVVRLRQALIALAKEAHASGLTPERVLIGLKHAWTSVCGRYPQPDIHDPAWHLVVRESLDAYEATRRRGDAPKP